MQWNYPVPKSIVIYVVLLRNSPPLPLSLKWVYVRQTNVMPFSCPRKIYSTHSMSIIYSWLRASGSSKKRLIYIVRGDFYIIFLTSFYVYTRAREREQEWTRAKKKNVENRKETCQGMPQRMSNRHQKPLARYWVNGDPRERERESGSRCV
jgi:hypothetical protein